MQLEKVMVFFSCFNGKEVLSSHLMSEDTRLQMVQRIQRLNMRFKAFQAHWLRKCANTAFA